LNGLTLVDLIAQVLIDALAELPQGGRHALATCLVEWNAGRLPAKRLVDFGRSIAWQSHALTQLFSNARTAGAESSACELLSAADMQVCNRFHSKIKSN
jgi:hypothetical protein